MYGKSSATPRISCLQVNAVKELHGLTRKLHVCHIVRMTMLTTKEAHARWTANRHGSIEMRVVLSSRGKPLGQVRHDVLIRRCIVLVIGNDVDEVGLLGGGRCLRQLKQGQQHKAGTDVSDDRVEHLELKLSCCCSMRQVEPMAEYLCEVPPLTMSRRSPEVACSGCEILMFQCEGGICHEEQRTRPGLYMDPNAWPQENDRITPCAETMSLCICMLQHRQDPRQDNCYPKEHHNSRGQTLAVPEDCVPHVEHKIARCAAGDLSKHATSREEARKHISTHVAIISLSRYQRYMRFA